MRAAPEYVHVGGDPSAMSGWTEADQAELDVLLWALVTTHAEHRARGCHACDPTPCARYEWWLEHKADCLICDGVNHDPQRRHAPLTNGWRCPEREQFLVKHRDCVRCLPCPHLQAAIREVIEWPTRASCCHTPRRCGLSRTGGPWLTRRLCPRVSADRSSGSSSGTRAPPTCSPSDDPGPTPFLVEDLIVEAVDRRARRPAEARQDVGAARPRDRGRDRRAGARTLRGPPSGPVLLILEESGRAALHRRLDKLVRGRAIDRRPARRVLLRREQARPSRRRRLAERLLDAAGSREWRLIAFDPLARVKGLVDENVQREIGPVLDFLRDLREASGATVAYVHHSGARGHAAARLLRPRGVLGVEAHARQERRQADAQAEHREAEGAGPFVALVRLRRDDEDAAAARVGGRARGAGARATSTSTRRVRERGLRCRRGQPARVLELVRLAREGGSNRRNHREPPPPGQTGWWFHPRAL